MRISMLSDTHGLHRELGRIRKSDMLIFAGDFMNSGHNLAEAQDFLDWFSSHKHTYKIMIAGNHDVAVENMPQWFDSVLKQYPDIIYLEDNFVEIKGYKIYGTPHSKHFGRWAFNRSEEQLENLFDNIPLDTDILVSHAPAYETLDRLMDGRQVGEKTLADKIFELDNLKLHVCGHIHQSYGMCKPLGSHLTVNAAVVDESYQVVNPIIEIKI